MRFAAFLRGINVGGRRVTGPELCAPFEALGYRRVVSFLASGNVAFEADDADDRDALEARIEAALESALGFPVESFVRDASEVTAILAVRPFPDEVFAATAGKPQVTFLHRSPTPETIAEVNGHATDDDRLMVVGREWFWLPAGGISQSSLDLRAIERALGRGTTRTLNTVTRLHDKYLGPSS